MTPVPPYARPLTWVLWLAIGAAVALVLAALRDALLPFLLAFVVAYVFAPWVNGLERRLKVPRPLGTALVFTALVGLGAGLLLGLVPLLREQLGALFMRLPDAVEQLRTHGVPWVADFLAQRSLPNTVEGWREAATQLLGKFGPAVLKSTGGALWWAASGTFGAVLWVVSAAIVPVLVCYLLMDFPRVSAWLVARIPGAVRTTVVGQLARIDRMLGEYLRGQLTVGVILSGLYAGGLTLAGVEAALVIGIIAGLGNMVPYLGLVVGLTLALVVTLLTHFDWIHLVYVVAVFGVVQLLEGLLISPKVVGDRIGLHPVAIILALFVGGEAFGFLGILLGVPVAIAVKVLLEGPTVSTPPTPPAVLPPDRPHTP